MKKLLLIGIAACLVGVLGGTGVHLATAPPPPAKELSAGVAEGAVDSTQASEGSAAAARDGETRELAGPGAPDAPADSSTRESTPAAEAPVASASLEEEALKRESAAEAEDKDRPSPSTGSGDYKLLAKILASMKPAEVGRMMEFMSDGQVEKTVRAMGPRQAAILFAQLSPERAAAIGRKLIGASDQEEK